MALLTRKKFDFVSSGLAPETFGVVRFKGSEGFSKCYEFGIDLVSTEAEIDLNQVLKDPATFIILREEGNIPFHGILAEFEQLHQVDEFVFYRAVLVPKLWWLSLTHHNQVILDKKVPEMIEAALKDGGGLTAPDFDMRLQGNYPTWEYVCQYRESHLDFVSRWMEREGMYWYFEQGQDAEKVIVTDTRMAHQPMSHGKTMHYSPPSGLAELHREEIIKSLVCRQKMLPKSLKLKDYNDQKPSLEISGNAEVKPDGRGEVYIYGEHFHTPEEGNALARIRGEALRCQEKRFYGESTIPYLRPGYLFDLQDHYRSDFNQGYLTIELTHEGSQAAYLLAGIQKGLSGVEQQPYYRNSFVAIPGSAQYRPECRTEKARFFGTMNAKIDAEGSGKYAELDEHGRYKVALPFDLSGRKDGKASAWLRMAQPYAGTDHGMHFPLHKGTEVLLTFIDGDPDRPIVQGAVPNPETPSVVTSTEQTASRIETAGGHKVVMEDEEGKESLGLHCSHGKGDGSWLWIGKGSPAHQKTSESQAASEDKKISESPKSAKSTDDAKKGSPVHQKTSESQAASEDKKISESPKSAKSTDDAKKEEPSWQLKSKGNKHEVVCGQNDDIVLGSRSTVTIGSNMDALLGTASEFTLAQKFSAELAGTVEFIDGHHVEFAATKECIKDKEELLGTDEVKIEAGLSAEEKAKLSDTAKSVAKGLAAVGALLSSTGGTLMSAGFPDEKEGKAALQGLWNWVPAAAGAVAQVVAMSELVQNLKTELLNPYSTMTLNGQGVDIKTTERAGEGIKATCGSEQEKSFMHVQQGTITISNKNDSAKMVMDRGNSVEISKNAGGKVLVGDDVTVSKGQGEVLVKSDQVKASTGAGSAITVTPSSITMEQSGKQISIDSGTIKMKFGGSALSLSPVGIQGQGTLIKLG